eukprot:TRINITY_DN1296_c0_g1_i2.p1 TRINITY_DN1296_c0_g1~~TRINITY_DN1296_c0_g1_i2.p1  ORF type:complete len:443 (+),score=86.93 TRINITY_DN1296_c0_g1_i2:3-1331(+)
MEATLGLPLPRHPLLLPWHRHAHKQRNTSSCCWRTDGITFSVNVHALSFSSSAVLFRIRPNSTFSSSSILFNKTKVRRRSGALALLDLFSRQRTKKEDSIEKLVERPAYAPWDKVRMGPLQVAPMGMGTWAWGNKLLWGYTEAMDADLQNVFNLVVSRGVDLFDTADSYGTGRLNGRSEMLLGKFMKQYPGSKRMKVNIKIATKLAAYPWRITTGQMVNAARGSLRRLGQEKLAIAQLHWPTANYQPLQERVLWDGLAAMYDEGLAECVGVSNYGPRQLEKIGTFLEVRGVPLAAVQVQFSLLSTGPQQEELLAACRSSGARVIAYSPLGLGMLTGKYSAEKNVLPSGPRGLLFRQILPGLGPLLQLMRDIATRRKKTMSQVAINWCICKGAVPIPGAKTLQQAEENLGALGWRLSGAEVAALDDAAAAVPRPMLQNIFQTK